MDQQVYATGSHVLKAERMTREQSRRLKVGISLGVYQLDGSLTRARKALDVSAKTPSAGVYR